MHNPASVLDNETQTFLWHFELKTDHLNSARRPDLIITNKKENLQNFGLCCPADHKVKLKESEKKDKYLNLARERRKL